MKSPSPRSPPAQLSTSLPTQLPTNPPTRLCLCLLCGNSFKNAKYARYHEEKHEESIEPCPTCGRTFVSGRVRYLHVIAKGGCDQADYMPITTPWISKFALTGIIEGMTWACTACEICFQDRITLVRHARQYHPQKAEVSVTDPSTRSLKSATPPVTNSAPKPVHNGSSIEEDQRETGEDPIRVESPRGKLPSDLPSSHDDASEDEDYNEDK